MVCGRFYDIIFLIQRPEREVALRATGFLVIKTIQPHIRLLDFLRAVVKRIGGVHFGRNGYFHFRRENRIVGALDALRGYFKYSGHNFMCLNLRKNTKMQLKFQKINYLCEKF